VPIEVSRGSLVRWCSPCAVAALCGSGLPNACHEASRTTGPVPAVPSPPHESDGQRESRPPQGAGQVTRLLDSSDLKLSCGSENFVGGGPPASSTPVGSVRGVEMHRNRRHQVSGSEAVSSEEVRELAPFQGSGSAREVVHQAQEACSAERRPWAGCVPARLWPRLSRSS